MKEQQAQTVKSRHADLLRQVLAESDLERYLYAAYDEVLVPICGARQDTQDRYTFVLLHLKQDYPCTEYRFGGHLGFGGKFRLKYDANATVDCYPEDETAKTRDIVKRANIALSELREAFVSGKR